MRASWPYFVVAGFLLLFVVLNVLVTLSEFSSCVSYGYTWCDATPRNVMTVLAAIPAVAALAFGTRTFARNRRLRNVGTILGSYDDVPISELATRLQTTPGEAQRLVETAIAANYAHGSINPATGVFRREAPGTSMQKEVVTRERVLVRCKFCGALSEQGQTRCVSCGGALG